jgi:head-tail adaptor
MLLSRRPKKSLSSQCRHYCNIEERAYADDGQGGQKDIWSIVSENVPMSLTPLNAKRKEEYRTFNVDSSHEIKVRGEITLVEANNRITFGTRIFEIKTIEDVQERGIEQICICLERRD